jgi:hypothetical protein
MIPRSHSNGNYLDAGAPGPADGGGCALGAWVAGAGGATGTTTAGVGAGAAAFGADGGAMIVAAG